MFKAAWLSQQTARVIGSGKNYLPTVHVRDLAACVSALHKETGAGPYQLCVDQGDHTQSEIVQVGLPIWQNNVFKNSTVENIIFDLWLYTGNCGQYRRALPGAKRYRGWGDAHRSW